MKPKFRCATKKALDELAIELNLRERILDWDLIAGYSYTPSNPADIQEYLTHYALLIDGDKKFVLMEMILEAIVEQSSEMKFMIYWEQAKPFLINDYTIHEYTIQYWKQMTTANFENCKLLTPLLHKIISL